MNWLSIWRDIIGGLLLAGALAVPVPKDFWKAFFLESHPILAKFWGPIVGPQVAIASFLCSVGNVQLAAVLCTLDFDSGQPRDEARHTFQPGKNKHLALATGLFQLQPTHAPDIRQERATK